MTSVLVVEDDTTFRSTLARDLGARGYTVVVASGVDDALAALAGGRFEVLLTDLRLDGRDGIDLLKRARRVAPATRSILMSGFASARDHQRAIELGAVRVLCKPFGSAELHQAIGHARDCTRGDSASPVPPAYTTTIERPAQVVVFGSAQPEDVPDTADLARDRLRDRWKQLIGDGPPMPDTSEVIGIDTTASASVRIAGLGDPETWLAPLDGMVASAERVCGARRGALQGSLGRIQLAVLWDRDQRYCFLITDVVTSGAGNAWFRSFATAVARGVFAG